MEGLRARTAELDRTAQRLMEKRAASRYDKIGLLLAAASSPKVLTDAAFREAFLALTADKSVDGQVLDANLDAVRLGRKSEQELETLLLSRLLARAVGLSEREEEARLISLFLSDAEADAEPDEEEPQDGNRVIYLRSSYADQAYKQFSAVVPELRADYATGFGGVCEAVYDSRARLCILPLENNIGGAMASFRNLIARHELKIICTCDVVTGEEEVTRFALLKKTLRKIPGQRSASGDGFFRFTLVPSDDISLASVLTAAEQCDLKLYKTDAIPISYTDNDFAYDITLRTGGDLAAFLTYLTLCAPGFEAVGLYENLGL